MASNRLMSGLSKVWKRVRPGKRRRAEAKARAAEAKAAEARAAEERAAKARAEEARNQELMREIERLRELSTSLGSALAHANDEMAAQRRASEDLLARVQAELDRKVDNNPYAVPDIVKAWERLYDRSSGGWYAPGWLDHVTRFTPDQVEAWRRTHSERYPELVNYAPVELEVANFYYWFCLMTRPRLVLETGTNMGYSTTMLAAALERIGADGCVYTIDMREGHQLFRDTPLSNRVRFLHGSSLDVGMPTEEPFDLLVLDSDHTYGTVMQELCRFEPVLKVGGHILMHDSMFFDGVALAVLELMANPRFEVVTMRSPRTHLIGTRPPGMSIVRKVMPNSVGHPLEFQRSLAKVEVDLSPERNSLSAPLVDLHHEGNLPAL